MSKEVKNYGRSARSKLLNVRNSSGYAYQLLLTRYLQERLLHRLSQSKYRKFFVLKGGALLYAYSGLKARPTFDVYFIASNISNDKENLKEIFAVICTVPCKQDGVVLDASSIHAENVTGFKEYHGVRVKIIFIVYFIEQVQVAK